MAGIAQLWRLLYYISYQASRLYFLAFSGAKHIYVKGSYVSGSYEPLISDIDFVLIYDDDGERSRRAANKWKQLCPLVKDADCFSEESFYLRRRFGSLKYANLENWRKLDSRFVRPAQRANFPLKDSFDIAQELYFFWEWTHFNLDKGENPYRLRCVNKALEKASRLVSFQPKPVENSFQALQALEKIAQMAKEESAAFERFSSLVDYDPDDILERPWYKNKFHISEAGEYMPHKINMSRETFKFFYVLGVIDSAVLLEEIAPKEDKRLASALRLEYFLNIEEGRSNKLHAVGKNIDVQEDLSLLNDTDSRKELSRFQHLYKVGPLEPGVTYWFQTKFSANLEGKVFARMENCRSDDVVFTDRSNGQQRAMNVNFFSHEKFEKAVLSLTSTFSSFSSFEMDDFLKDQMSSDSEGDSTWAGEHKADNIKDKTFVLNVEKEMGPSWHKAVFHLKGLYRPYRVETLYSNGELLSSPRIQFSPEDYLTVYFRPGERLREVKFKVSAEEVPTYAEVVCFSLKEV